MSDAPARLLDRIPIDPASVDVVLDQFSHGNTNAHLVRRIIEQVHIGRIPSYQSLIGIHDADPLRDILEHGLQHVAFKPGRLRLVIQHGQNIRQGHIAATDRRGKDDPCRR